MEDQSLRFNKNMQSLKFTKIISNLSMSTFQTFSRKKKTLALRYKRLKVSSWIQKLMNLLKLKNQLPKDLILVKETTKALFLQLKMHISSCLSKCS